jgi:hypothetical protein
MILATKHKANGLCEYDAIIWETSIQSWPRHTHYRLPVQRSSRIDRTQKSFTRMTTCRTNYIHSAHTTKQNRLFLHAEFHPRGNPRRMIRQLYNHTLAKTKLFDDFIVAYHQPKNLRDLLSKTKLQSSPSVPSESKLVSFTRSVSNP